MSNRRRQLRQQKKNARSEQQAIERDRRYGKLRNEVADVFVETVLAKPAIPKIREQVIGDSVSHGAAHAMEMLMAVESSQLKNLQTPAYVIARKFMEKSK